jgi:hypothetical protein
MFNIVLWLYIASQKKKRLPESRVSTDCLSYSKSFFLILAHHLVLISDSDRPNQLSPSLLSLSVASLSLSLHACMCLFCTTILHISKSSSYISYLCVCVCVCRNTLCCNPFRSHILIDAFLGSVCLWRKES